MKIKRCVLLVLGANLIQWFCLPGTAISSPQFNRTLPPALAQMLSHSVYTAPSNSNKTYITVYFKIPNDMLLFTYTDTMYTAKAEVTVALETSKGEVAESRIIQKEVQTKEFVDTNSKQLAAEDKAVFLVEPGRYKLIINLLDLSTRKPVTISETLTAPSFHTKNLACSEIRFFNKTKNRLPEESDFPVLPAARGPEDSLIWTQFYLYTREPSSPHKVIYSIINVQGKNLYQDSLTFIPGTEIKSMYYSIGQALDIGKYFISVSIANKNQSVYQKNEFFIKGKGQTALLDNPLLFIKALKYIADKNDYKKISEAPLQEQQDLLAAFWKERDPNPGTEINELENEFYRRVNYVNINFSQHREKADGWQTDMGRVYIIYGPPTEIERMDTPRSATQISRYEIWYYRNIGKKFIFVDRYGSQHFILVSEE